MLKVTWLDPADAALDRAIAALPACEACPHDIYLRLIRLPQAREVRAVLVEDGAGPVAIAGLARQYRLVWEPVTNWLFPGAPFPAVAGRHIEAMAALRMEAPMAWWRAGPAPHGANIHDLEITPVHRLDDLAKREEFWRSTDYLRHIKNIRNRAKGLEVRIGVPEIAEEVVAGWFDKWTNGDRAHPQVRGRVVLADALEPLGAHVTVGLFDDDKLAAGATNFIHNGALVAGILYAPDAYRRLGAGIRLIDVMFDVAAERGLSAFDMGGGAEYKRKWAPAIGERASFTVAPPAVRLARRVIGKARALVGRGAARQRTPSPE